MPFAVAGCPAGGNAQQGDKLGRGTRRNRKVKISLLHKCVSKCLLVLLTSAPGCFSSAKNKSESVYMQSVYLQFDLWAPFFHFSSFLPLFVLPYRSHGIRGRL